VSLRKKFFVVFAGMMFFASTLIPLVGAQNNQAAGNGLQISPTRTDISASPGEVKPFTVTIKNITDIKLTLRATLNDFESDNVTGNPQIIVDDRRTPYTLEKMLTGLENIEIEPDGTKTVKLALDIPGNTPAGAYFGAIRFQAVPNSNNESERQIALNASVAHLVFLDIPGEVVEQVQVEEVNIQRAIDGNVSSGSFFFQPPNQSSLKIKNLGNGFSRPFGRITVNYNGNEVYGYDLNNKEPRGIILPNSTRVFDDEIKNVTKPGKYTVVASVTYGSGGEVANYSKTFWYLPFWFLAIVAVVIILLVAGGYWGYKKYVAKRFSK